MSSTPVPMAPVRLMSGSVTLLTLFVLGFGYWTSRILYRRFLHPLASFPGPFWPAVSRLPWWWASLQGRQVSWEADLHTRYGAVVRTGPNDLSYAANGTDAWQAIHGNNKGQPEFGKAIEFHAVPNGGKHFVPSSCYFLCISDHHHDLTMIRTCRRTRYCGGHL